MTEQRYHPEGGHSTGVGLDITCVLCTHMVRLHNPASGCTECDCMATQGGAKWNRFAPLVPAPIHRAPKPDNLIAEARKQVEASDWRDAQSFMAGVEWTLAALDAVQPVTPDRKTLVKALWETEQGETTDAEWSIVMASPSPRLARLFDQADALLASGVLGQPQPLDSAPEIPGFEGTLDALDGLTIRKGTQ